MNELEAITKILFSKENVIVIRREDITRWILDNNPTRMYSTGYGLPGLESFSYMTYNPTYTLKLRENYKIGVDRPVEIIFELLSGEFKSGTICDLKCDTDGFNISIIVKNIVWSL